MSKKPKYITLGQFLKLSEYVSSGGEAKMRIHEFDITVNGEKENRRGKKLYDGDKVIINGDSHVIKHED
jgi:ribosome-associated protein YbcJ (S4-like RNA binding protein)